MNMNTKHLFNGRKNKTPYSILEEVFKKMSLNILQCKKGIFINIWLNIFSPVVENWGNVIQRECFQEIYQKMDLNTFFDNKVFMDNIFDKLKNDDNWETYETIHFIIPIFVCIDLALNISDEKSYNSFKEEIINFTIQVDEFLLYANDIQDKSYPKATNELRFLGWKILPYINQKLLDDWKNDNIQNDIYYEDYSVITKMYTDALDTILEILSSEKIDEVKNIILDINKKMFPIIDFGKLFFRIYP